MAESFAWWVANDPTRIGLSHNATGEGSENDAGVLVVETILEVHSVDLVTSPATTGGLFEGFTRGKGRATLASFLAMLESDDPHTGLVEDPTPERDSDGNELPGQRAARRAGADSGTHLCKMVKAILADSSLDAAAKRAKIMLALKCLDEDDAEDQGEDEALDESMKAFARCHPSKRRI
jgi:hypothetical protein